MLLAQDLAETMICARELLTSGCVEKRRVQKHRCVGILGRSPTSSIGQLPASANTRALIVAEQGEARTDLLTTSRST